jgi:hypothetical protein
MFDVAWCQSILSNLADRRWDTHRILTDFTEALEDARGVWRDSAGREVDTRFLIPHGSESVLIHERADHHGQSLNQSLEQMQHAETAVMKLREVSVEIQNEVTVLNDDIDDIYSQNSVASRSGAEAQSKSRQSQSILASI